jgi:putative ABC transport system substrate-binding protein
MKRRQFITLLGGGAAWPLAAHGQQSGRIVRIGILSTANPRSSSFYQSFERRLRDLGHIEGQNIVFEYRNAEGEVDRLPDLAAELTRLDPSIIVSSTDAATSAVKRATSTIPILVVAVNYDPIALGYVDNLARPGGNITGLFFQHLELLAKRFGLFMEMLPSVGRVAVFSDSFTTDQLEVVQAANKSVVYSSNPCICRIRHTTSRMRFALPRGRVPRRLWRWSLRPSFAAALRSRSSQRIADYRRASHFASTWRSVVWFRMG